MPSDLMKQKKRGRPRKDGAELPPEVIAASAEHLQAKMSDAEVLELIKSRFDTLRKLATAMIEGKNRAMVVSGAPGIGKTYTLHSMLEHSEKKGKIKFNVVKGFMTAAMLYRLLYQNRESNCITVLDDCDDVFRDDTAVNILKAALDTSERRIVSYRAMNVTDDESNGGEEIPAEFEFEGSMMFITNIDFHAFLAGPAKRVTPHISALIDRSFYLDMKLHGPRALALWIRYMLTESRMLQGAPHGMTAAQSADILDWLLANRSRVMPQLSLRSAVKCAQLVKMDESGWKIMADTTLCK